MTDKKILTTKNVALLGVGIALYVVLSFTMKIPLISHIQTDLGYVAFGIMLGLLGPLATFVGVIGCLLESLLMTGWVPLGWMLGQLLIGLICGYSYKKITNIWLNILITLISVFLGVGIVKTLVECSLYGIPLLIKLPKNLIAFIADSIPLILGYLMTIKTSIKQYIEKV